MGCHFLLQGIFSTQGLNLGLLHGSKLFSNKSHAVSLIFILRFEGTNSLSSFFFFFSLLNEFLRGLKRLLPHPLFLLLNCKEVGWG